MKIAFVSYDFGEYCVRHANALAAYADVQLSLAEGTADELEQLLSPAVDYRPFAKPRLRQPGRQFVSLMKLRRTIDKFRPDVVHFQGGHLWFNLALPQLGKYPLVVTAHNPRHHVGDQDSRKTPQWVMDLAFRRADRLIVHGEELKKQVVERLGVAADKVHVIPHITMGGTQLPSEVHENPHTVLFFGRIWQYKGLEYLIRAEPLIAKHVPDLQIVIAGRGEDMDRYRRMMVHPERFAVQNEWIDSARRAELFQQAALVVLPYIEATQSGVVPVAYTHGKPVVATRVGGLPECVDHDETGLLVPPRDERALADAIVRLLTNADLRRRLGSAGREKLAKECAPEVVARMHLDVYAAAVRDRGALVEVDSVTTDHRHSTHSPPEDNRKQEEACEAMGVSD